MDFSLFLISNFFFFFFWFTEFYFLSNGGVRVTGIQKKKMYGFPWSNCFNTHQSRFNIIHCIISRVIVVEYCGIITMHLVQRNLAKVHIYKFVRNGRFKRAKFLLNPTWVFLNRILGSNPKFPKILKAKLLLSRDISSPDAETIFHILYISSQFWAILDSLQLIYWCT